MPRLNEFGQPVGADLGGWAPPAFPEAIEIRGQYVSLVPLKPEHAGRLYDVLEPAPDSMWTYMSMGPFEDVAGVEKAIENMASYLDRQPFAVVVGGEPLGFASYLRIDPPGGVIEVGSIVFSPRLERTREATEAIYLLIDHAFRLGYRRCEWKCDGLNERSRRAAERFGFRYEGTFLNATHYKGRSRDTAWYAIVDREWIALREAYRLWLSPGNHNASGAQHRSLGYFVGNNTSSD